MAVAKPLLALVALILIAGGMLLNIFIILSGTHIHVAPVDKIFWLSADTSGITGAPATTAWTYFSRCSLVNGDTTNCGKVSAAYPFDPISNFGTNKGIPTGFNDTKFYFYMSRVSWSFYLIALFFAAVTLALGVFACCARIAGYLSGFCAFLALGSQTVAVTLMTAWVVKARNAFRAGGVSASLGRYALGFSWATFACFLIAMLLFCTSGGVSSRKKRQQEEEEQQEQQQVIDPATGQPIDVQEQQHTGGGGFFGRNSTAKNRESGVKDEYS